MAAKGTAVSKGTVFVGGLSQQVTQDLLYSAFIAFGEIVSVQLPIDSSSSFYFLIKGKTPPDHRGFGFIEFESEGDALAAIDNMDQSEMVGRVIKVTKAKPLKIAEGSFKAIWSEEDYLRKEAQLDRHD